MEKTGVSGARFLRLTTARKLTALLLMGNSLAMADSVHFTPRIETTIAAGRLVVSPRITADTAANLRYELSARKEGPAGVSNSNQSGRVAVKPGNNPAFSRLELGLEPTDRYAILLRLYAGDQLVAEDAMTFPR